LEAGVLSAYRLAQDAAQDRDSDLLRSILPPGDEWRQRRTVSGDRVTLDVSARDEALAQRRAALLAEWFGDQAIYPYLQPTHL